MKQTINLYTFRQAFTDYNRNDNFTYEGLEALYHNLLEWEEGTEQELELDVIALCCDFTEYADLDEVAEEYNIEPDEVEDYTTVITFDGGVIIQNW